MGGTETLSVVEKVETDESNRPIVSFQSPTPEFRMFEQYMLNSLFLSGRCDFS